MPIPFAAFVPMIAAAGQNILQGINNRNARRYNEPVQQVRRLREAGLPTAAGTSIQAGGGVATPVSSFGAEAFNDNIGKGTIRQTDKQTLEKVKQEVSKATSEAAIAAGNAKNQLNPAGIFEPTNQGAKIQQDLVQQEEAIKNAQTVNKWLNTEKAQNVLRTDKEIAKISADTANSLTQNKILVSDAQIKKIIAQWQGKMSQGEFTNLVRRNTGLQNANEISAIQGEILRNTKIAQIQKAQMEAELTNQNIIANDLGLIVKGLETESAKTYYKVKSRVDESYKEQKISLFSPFDARDMLYLQLFTPKESSINLSSMSNIFKQ